MILRFFTIHPSSALVCRSSIVGRGPCADATPETASHSPGLRSRTTGCGGGGGSCARTAPGLALTGLGLCRKLVAPTGPRRAAGDKFGPSAPPPPMGRRLAGGIWFGTCCVPAGFWLFVAIAPRVAQRTSYLASDQPTDITDTYMKYHYSVVAQPRERASACGRAEHSEGGGRAPCRAPRQRARAESQ